MAVMNLFDLNPEIFKNVEVNKNAKKKRNKKHNVSFEQLDLFDIMFSPEAKENYVNQYVAAVEETINEVKKPISQLFEVSSELIDYRLTKQLKMDGTVSEKIERNIKAIQLLNTLKAYGKYAKENEQKVLAKYTGWGGLSEAFQKSKYNYRIKNLLSSEEYTSITDTVNTAFFTPIDVSKFMYSVLERLGFDGGHILEPAVGTGQILGVMPNNMRENSKIVAIEKDCISGTIAKQLYQTAEVNISGYEDIYLKDDSFDLIITNVPFVDVSVADKYDTELNKLNLLLHDYYFAKSLKKVREGGIIACITSAGTMDKQNDKLRKLLSDKCDLLGAVRLPYNTFKANANVDVMTDIIFLQKTNEPTETDWLNVQGYNGATINEYYINNPEMMIGDLTAISSKFGTKYVLKYEGCLEKELTNLISKFPQDIYTSLDDDSYRYEDKDIINIAGTNLEKTVKPFSYLKYENKYYQRQGVHLLPINAKNPQLLETFIALKSKIKEIIDAQLDNCSDDTLKLLQDELNEIYDTFNMSYGYINSKGVKKLLDDDPEYYLTASIENEITTNIFGKGEFFTQRTIGKKVQVDYVDNIEDALLCTFDAKGAIDINYMAHLLRKDIEDVKKELIEKKLIFFDVELDEFVYKDEYLSGNVRKKLRAAQKFVVEVPQLSRNITALEAVQPEYIYDVYFQLGTTWISEKIYTKFIESLLQCKTVTVTYNKTLGKYSIESTGYINPVLNRTTYGTDRLNAIQILRHGFNLTNPVIYDEIDNPDGTTKRVKNVQATELARTKVELVRSQFTSWVDNNVDVKNEMLDYYNENYNNIVNRTYYGDYLKPRINPTIELRPYQKNAIARILESKHNTLLAHEVGAGKTFTTIVSIMLMKKLGKITKPIFVIPNSLVESGQYVSEFLKIYPYANVLAATSKDFSKANRRKFINKIATVDWDAIVIGHSSFKLIPMDKDFQLSLLSEKINELEALVSELDDREDRISIKQIKKQIERLKGRYEKLMISDVDDGLPTFDKLGVDFIACDEAHNYKNLQINTKLTGISGVQTTDAQKSFDLSCKMEYLRRKHGNKIAVFSTATPISNSVCEAYTMMKYLIPEVLESYGLGEFDSWASVYGKIVSQLEVDVTGKGFKVKDRFAQFSNVPELITMFKETADIVTKEQLNIPLPKLKDGKITNVVVEPSKKIKDYINTLVERAEAIEAKRVKPEEDNMLNITTDGRKVATDPRLVGIEVTDDTDTPKLNALCENVYREYIEGKSEKLTQLIFLNLGTPSSKGFNLYNAIREKLVEMGIPKRQVQFIHDANTPEKRAKMITEFRNGDFRILMGSTAKCGEGSNFQHKLKSIHEMDAEWKPACCSQKIGRILRFGNQNKEVSIYRYSVRSSFDVYMYQTCETKAKYIDQIMNSKTGARTIEDLGDTILSFAETKALACENPLIMEKFKIDKQIQSLQVLEKAYKGQQMISYRRKMDFEFKKEEVETLINELKVDVDFSKLNTINDFIITINDRKYTERVDAGNNLIEYLDVLKVNNTQELLEKPMKVGEYRGFDLMYKLSKDVYNGSLVKILGLKHNKFHAIDYSISPAGLIAKIVNRVNGLNDTLDLTQKRYTEILNVLSMIENEMNNTFAKTDELKELLIRQQEINKQLNVNSGTTEVLTEEAV